MKETTPLNLNDLSKAEGTRLIAAITEAMAKHDQPASRAEFEAHTRASKEDLRVLNAVIDFVAEDHGYTANNLGTLKDMLGHERRADAGNGGGGYRLKRLDEIEAKLDLVMSKMGLNSLDTTEGVGEFHRPSVMFVGLNGRPLPGIGDPI